MTKEMELYRGGSWDSAYTYLGAHPAPQGYTFRVWAPHARCVALAGDFNGWQSADMHRDADGVWSLTVENAAVYDSYKYIVTGADGRTVWKADPFAFHAQTRPGSDSKVYDLSGYGWRDEAWRAKCAAEPPVNGPLLIYEVHLGSWRRHEDGTSLSYRELARGAARLRQKHGLQLRGAAAGDGVSAGRQLGLSVYRLFRPHQPLRHTPRFHGAGGCRCIRRGWA